MKLRTPPPKWSIAAQHDYMRAKGLEDIAAGRHAVGCACEREFHTNQAFEVTPGDYYNGCLTIAKAALAGESYQVEEES